MISAVTDVVAGWSNALGRSDRAFYARARTPSPAQIDRRVEEGRFAR